MKKQTVIHVRAAEPEDWRALHAILTAPAAAAGTFSMPYNSAEVFRRMLAEPGGDHRLLGCVNGEPVGAVILMPQGPARRAHCARLAIAVRDDWQGQGIGTRLMAAVTDLADNWLGLARIELEVFVDNAAAIAMYRRAGFDTEGCSRGFALRHGALVDVYRMARLRGIKPWVAPAVAANEWV
ncbi:GNAT family N-acetyltransferase [Niveibacterium sp. 24ML]|uniref:GNAT family N-acetyltransferase n=1 Tax=Niveibacterium sp. 24ML TaxID=2985512 RepID=UPI00227135E1|nr:GNAT family N-acetyltransferase [Niveibacterium sp. 24ML]MCX9154551.1 GNAT family N-acetyltransferase [Niveibacterium sp. 24ML]